MQEAAGVALVLETDDEVVGVAHDDHVARGLTLSPAHGPQIEYVVQVDVGQERRDDRALPCPPLTDGHDPVFHDARLEPFADEADDAHPRVSGALYFVDVVFGIMLVAYSEEIVFRRCARHVFKIYMDDGNALVLVTSLLFGAYHWWTGIGNIIEALMMGVLLMLFFRRSAALWPVVLGHYLTDIADFA